MDLAVAHRHVTSRLEREFKGQFDAETIDRYVDQAFEELKDHAAVESWVPVLAERFARQQLQALAKVEGHRDSLPVVLFLDTHDAGRSQLARALFDRHAGDRAHAWSGGLSPAHRIQPEVTAVLEEYQITLVNEFPKPITDQIIQGADVIVALGGVEVEAPGGAQVVSWPVPEIADLDVAGVAEVRDHLDGRTAELARELLD